MRSTRREFLRYGTLTAAGLAGATGFVPSFDSSSLASFATEAEPPLHPLFEPGEYRRIDSQERTFHVSASMDNFELCPELPEIWKEVGVTDVWFCSWFYGFFPYSWEQIDGRLDEIKRHGLRPHLIAVPFCHGGGALDPPNPGSFPNLPPRHWKLAKRWEGDENWGFSYHSPADVEGAEAIRTLYKRYGRFDYFLDDDFRFASSPDRIGGCVCPECKANFLKKYGYAENRWNELLGDLKENRDTPLLRSWADYFCDRLTACFRLLQNAEPEVDLGIMVMYMGSERGGIRLGDYSDALFRVGEGMFGDSWYDPPKQKSVELFSVLFHRRYAAPGRAFSETTIYPEGSLSAENMASKLVFSTVADVRNTCFMSGLKPIPPEYWATIGPRMKREASVHSQIKGQVPKGPFKHFWGLAGRYLANGDPYSLFLTLGVPFEVCDKLGDSGWTFLGDADANELQRGGLTSAGTRCIARIASPDGRFERIPETFDDLFAFRRSCLNQFQEDGVPYVEEEVPAILAWYPESGTVLLWNIEKTPRTLNVRLGSKRKSVQFAALDSVLIKTSEFQEI